MVTPRVAAISNDRRDMHRDGARYPPPDRKFPVAPFPLEESSSSVSSAPQALPSGSPPFAVRRPPAASLSKRTFKSSAIAIRFFSRSADNERLLERVMMRVDQLHGSVTNRLRRTRFSLRSHIQTAFSDGPLSVATVPLGRLFCVGWSVDFRLGRKRSKETASDPKSKAV